MRKNDWREKSYLKGGGGDNTISVTPVIGVTMMTMKGRVPSPQWAISLFLGTMALFVVVGRLLFRLHPDAALLFAELLVLLVPTVLVVAYLRADFRDTLRLRLPTGTDILLAVPLAIALAVLNDQLMNLVSQVYPMPEAEQAAMVELLRATTVYEWAVRLFGIVVAAAISEEILFRGFIQRSLERGPLGRGGAIVLTAFLFAVIHLIPQGMPSYVLAGVVLGITAVATESILVPILIHAVHNMASILLLNVADMESLGQPVWIPPQILVPAVLIFLIALVYFLRRAPEPEPRNVPPSPRPSPVPPPDVPRERFVEPDGPVLKRRALGWLVVGGAALGGVLVVVGLFLLSLLYSPQARRQPIEDMRQDLLDSLPPSAEPLASQVRQEFNALQDFNESGNMSVGEFLRLLWTYSAARSDGTITEPEIEEILSRIRLVLRENTRIRQL